MRWMLSAFAWSILHFSSGLYADDDLDLILDVYDGNLKIELVNVGYEARDTSKYLKFGSISQGANLVLSVESCEGDNFKYLATPRFRPPSEEKVFSLEPGMSIGWIRKSTRVVRDFGLKQGCFSLSAIYHASTEDGVQNDRISSSPITVELDDEKRFKKIDK